MSNYHYDRLRSNVAFRGTVAPTQKDNKVQWFVHAHKLQMYSFFHLFLICHRKTDNSERLTVVRNVLKPEYTNLNVFYRERE